MSQGKSNGGSQTLRIGGMDVTLMRKRVKNINLRIDRSGNINVSASPRVSQQAIEQFVESRLAWIEAARARLQREHVQQERSCDEGATVFLWGAPLTCRFDTCSNPKDASRYRFAVADGELVVSMRPDLADDADTRYRAFDRWLKSEMLAMVKKTLPTCEQVVGRSPSKVRIRSMKSRWGSCNTKTGTITLNAALVHYDQRCLSYVITHELCHLHEPSHNSRFHHLMDAFCPDWRTWRALLNSKQ